MTIVVPGPSVEVYGTLAWNPKPSFAKTGPISVPYLDLETVQGDKLSSVASVCSHVSYCAQIGDEDSKEEGESAGDTEEGMAKLGTIDKPGLICGLHKTHRV